MAIPATAIEQAIAKTQTEEILDTLLPERVHRNNQASCKKTCMKVSF